MTNRDKYKEAGLHQSPRLSFRATPTEGMRLPEQRRRTQSHSLCDWLKTGIIHLLWTIAVTVSGFQNMISMARSSVTENVIQVLL